MKTHFRILGVNANASLRSWLEKQLEGLQSLISVSTAEVVVERQQDNAPSFRVHVLLAVPGPDIHAAARDHTLEAAWLKVTQNLRKQIERRKMRHQQKLKSNRQLPATGIRWSGAMTGQRA